VPAKKSGVRAVTIEDLTRIKFVRSPALSPDETEICCVVETIPDDRKEYRSHLWRCNADGSALRQLTFGKRSDSSPVYSPDGRWIVFVSKRGDHPGIHLLPSDGGEAKPLVEKDGTFSFVSFSPDSQTIVCLFRANDPIPGAEKKPDKKSDPDAKPPKREAPIARHITRLAYREDGVGFYPKDQWHVWAFDVAAGAGRQLTKGRFSEAWPIVSPNGRDVLFVSNHRPDPDRDPYRHDLFVVPLKGGAMRRIPTPEGPIEAPSYSRDGKLIAYLGHSQPDAPWGVVPYHLWVVGANGTPRACDITPTFDRESYDLTISDTGEGFGIIRPEWSHDSKSLLYIVTDTGSTLLFRVSAKGGDPKPVARGQWHIQSATFGKKGKRAALLFGNAAAPAEIGTLELGTSAATPTRITGFNHDWLKTVHIARPQEVWFKSTNDMRIQGWVLKPYRFKTGRRYPAILEIHGGPRTQYGHTFFHEMQMLAGQGYVVFYTNPRGSQGRGSEFTASIVKGWGTVDYEDCMAATDWLEKQPYVDRKRIGVTGGSYGGYMTNWLVAHTNRYKAAVTQRSVVSLVSFFGSSDFGYLWKKEFGYHPWENKAELERMSPITYAENIRTPLLIIHNEHDMRCDIEQAEQLFAMLKMLRRKVEFVRFPEEPHGLSRHGRPDRRLARLSHILRWFDQYLRGKKMRVG